MDYLPIIDAPALVIPSSKSTSFEAGFTYPVTLDQAQIDSFLATLFLKGESTRLYKGFSLIASIDNSSFFVSTTPEKVIASSRKFLSKKFPGSTFSRPSSSLLLATIYTQNLFGRRFVKINLAIVASGAGSSSQVTILAIAYGESGFRKPQEGSYHNQIDSRALFDWVTYTVVPGIQAGV